MRMIDIAKLYFATIFAFVLIPGSSFAARTDGSESTNDVLASSLRAECAAAEGEIKRNNCHRAVREILDQLGGTPAKCRGARDSGQREAIRACWEQHGGMPVRCRRLTGEAQVFCIKDFYSSAPARTREAQQRQTGGGPQ